MARRPMSPKLASTALAAVLVTAIAVMGGCVSVVRPSADVEGVNVTTTAAPAPAAPVSEDCHGLPPTASYPPLATLPAPMQMPVGSTMRKIQDKGHLSVAVSADTLLFGAQNPLTGQVEGFDIDMLRLVAKAIFGDDNPNRLELKIITYAQRIPSLQDRSADLVAHTMTINCTRWNQVAFSSTYYDAGQKVLVRRDSKNTTIDALDAARATVCAPDGTTNIEELRRHTGVKVTAVPDVTDCLVLFQQGKVDAITGDDTVLAGFADQDPYAVVSGDAFTDEPYGIAANAADVDLVQFVNRVLADARVDGSWKAIYERWLGEFGPTPEPPAAEVQIRPIPPR